MSLVGASVDDLDTPALCVDLDAMEANIQELAGACRRHEVSWRPHAKCHKSIDVGRKLIAAGAIGLTCAKLGEAEVFAGVGMRSGGGGSVLWPARWTIPSSMKPFALA